MPQSSLKQPKYDLKDAQAAADAIFFFDSYRIHQYTEPKWIERATEAGRLGYTFRREWNDIKRIIIKLAKVPSSLMHVMNWAKYQNYVRMLGNVMATIVLVLFGFGAFFYYGRNQSSALLIGQLMTYIVPVVASGLIISYAGPIVIARRIDKELQSYRNQNPTRFVEAEAQLKVIVQDLIDSLAYAWRTGKLVSKKEEEQTRRTPLEAYDDIVQGIKHKFGRSKPPADARPTFELFNVDYKSIKIVSRPSKFRKYYVASVN
jgi:hypothetical protein